MSARTCKRCPRCGQVKPAAEFYRRRRSLRLSPYCQPCQRAASRETRSRRRADPASAALLRAADRTRQHRRRALRGQPPTGGAAA
jgi:transposase-like protein